MHKVNTLKILEKTCFGIFLQKSQNVFVKFAPANIAIPSAKITCVSLMVKPIKTIMYKINFIVLFGFFLTLSSTLYGANTWECPAENKANSEQEPANNAQNAGATVVNDDSFSSDESPSRSRSAPPPRQLCKKCKMPDHQDKDCPARTPNRQPLLVPFNNSSNKPVYPLQQININNNTPQISASIGIGNNSLCYNNMMLMPLNVLYGPLYHLHITPLYNYANTSPQYSNIQIMDTSNNQANLIKTINLPPYNLPCSSLHTIYSVPKQQLPPSCSFDANTPNNGCPVWFCTSIKTCKALFTIITCLKYWRICEDSGSLKQIFQYLSKANRYMHIVDAYHHLLDVHLKGKNTQEEYAYINKQVNKSLYCNFTTCKSYTRNQMPQEKLSVDDHKAFICLRDLLDNIHAYLVHGYDSGHRYIKDTKAAKVDNRLANASGDDEAAEWKNDEASAGYLFDHEMQALQARQASIRQQQRNQDKKDKFRTKINEEPKDSTISLALLKAKFGHELIFQRWLQYLLAYECDTDCVLEQIEDDGSSILYDLCTLDEKAKIMLFNKIKSYISQRKVGKKNNHHTTGRYAFGVKLYYWDYYKTRKKEYICYQTNIACKDLYVAPAYLSFKSEMLVKDISVGHWDQKIYQAEIILYSSSVLRKISATSHKYGLCHKYDIKENSRLSIYHILSLLFYANVTRLSTSFKASLEYLSSTERLQDIVKRNAHWHFLSKYLREAVEVFGEKIGLNDTDNMVDKGNFYHGFPYVSFREFRVYFYGPLSTSTQLPVATLFADNKGIVVTLNSCIGPATRFLKFFNVDLVSSFAAEDEKLFIGGESPLQIVSIRLLQQPNINTKPLIHTLDIVDRMIHGYELEDRVVLPSDILLFSKLLSNWPHFPHYVQQSWSKFKLRWRRKIKFNMEKMYKYYSLFIPLLFSSNPKHKNLLLLDKITNTFPNTSEITCIVTDLVSIRSKKQYYSPAIIGSDFILGIKDCVSKIKQNKSQNLKKITIKTSKGIVKDKFNLYVKQFGTLGWQIGKGPHTIALTKQPYDDCITKVSFMIRGAYPFHEATSLSALALAQLTSRAKEVPASVQQKWDRFTIKQQQVYINIKHVHKYYSAFPPKLLWADGKYKNLLSFDTIAKIFPNIAQIKCTSTDSITGGALQHEFSADIISSNFMRGLLNMLGKMNKKANLEKIIIQTYKNKINNNCNLYAPQFGQLGWQVGKGDYTIFLTKKLYDDFKADFIPKILNMVGGEIPKNEINSLDILLFYKLIAGDKNLPAHVLQTWTEFTCRQQTIAINMKSIKKHYKGLDPILLSKSIDNLLLLDKIATIFPNVTEIICAATDYTILNAAGGIEGFSPDIVTKNFISGLRRRLFSIPKHAKLKKIIIKTCTYKIKVNWKSYATQFGKLQWSIRIENRKYKQQVKGRIILTKRFLNQYGSAQAGKLYF